MSQASINPSKASSSISEGMRIIILFSMHCLLHLFRQDPAPGLTESSSLPPQFCLVKIMWLWVCLAEIMSLQLCRGGAHSATDSLLGIFPTPWDQNKGSSAPLFHTSTHSVVEVAALVISELHLGFFPCLKRIVHISRRIGPVLLSLRSPTIFLHFTPFLYFL